MVRLLDGEHHVLQKHDRRAHIHAVNAVSGRDGQEAQLQKRLAQRGVLRRAAADGVGVVAVQTARKQLVEQHPAALHVPDAVREAERVHQQKPPGGALAHLSGRLERAEAVVKLPHLNGVADGPRRKLCALAERNADGRRMRQQRFAHLLRQLRRVGQIEVILQLLPRKLALRLRLADIQAVFVDERLHDRID